MLKFQNGLRMAGELHVISRHGGLLALPGPVTRGIVVELTFQTHRGPVMGTAEMLTPISSTQQPFCFVGLPEADRCTLQTAFESGSYRNIDEEQRIEQLRAVVSKALAEWDRSASRRHRFGKMAIGLVTLMGGLAFALYTHFFPH